METIGEHKILVKESLETVNVDQEMEPLSIDLITDKLGEIHVVFDSGSTLNVIDKDYAYRNYRKYIKKLKGFFARTAGGKITINEYIPL